MATAAPSVESRDQGTAVIRLQLTIFGLDVERPRSLRTWKAGSLTASI